jgi:type 1 glutamine amidotransferase
VREAVKKGESQHLLWLYERPLGGRRFGFTGGHFHKNWGQPDYRKVVLNTILWVAQVEIPAHGVDTELTAADLSRNLDAK